jgi:hypothetical protein
MFNAAAVPIIRYRWPGHNIPSPWTTATTGTT